MSNDTIPRRGFLVGAGAAGAGARMYRAGPFHQGAPEQGYQLSLTPAQFITTGIAAAPSTAATAGSRRQGHHQNNQPAQ